MLKLFISLFPFEKGQVKLCFFFTFIKCAPQKEKFKNILQIYFINLHDYDNVKTTLFELKKISFFDFSDKYYFYSILISVLEVKKSTYGFSL